uniref:Uncharacterized protein n=1 Tax=Chenopodium quinoa TaxID=63459 RepID=A0A803N531_CHEQI
MAALNVSFTLKFPPKSSLSPPKPHLTSSLSSPLHPPHIELQKLQVSNNNKNGFLLPILDNPIASARADLSDADLRGADFSLANVTKANLTNANLEGALTTGNTSFRGSVITGADFTDVPLRDDQREYLCKVADG